MKAVIALAVGLALLGAACAAGDDPTVKLEGVSDLTPDSFDSIHNGRRAALIEFYAPWCGHCKRLVPEYSKLGAKIAADPKLRNRVLIAKVDADAHRSLGERFGVRGFPTLKWFPRGKAAAPVDYNGGRSLDDFLKFINEQVSADAGFARVDALVPLAQKFQAAPEGERAAVLAETEKAVADVGADDKDNAALYVRFMKKAVEKGAAYIEGELARLTKMAEKAMSATKADEVARKLSVLASFTEKPEEQKEKKEAAAAKKEEAHDEGDEYELDDEDEEAPAAAKADDDEDVYADGLDDNFGAEEEDHDEGHDHDDHEGHDHGAAEEDDPYSDEL